MSYSDEQLIETYWMLILLMNNLMELGHGSIAEPLVDIAATIRADMHMRHINPDDYEFDVRITIAEYEDEDSSDLPADAFNDFVNTLFEDEDNGY